MNKSHSIKERFVYFLIFIFIILFIPFIILKIGFTIPSFKSEKISVEQLYIKLDKKLIIRAKKVSLLENLEQTNDESFAKNLLFYVEKLDLFFTFFEEVHIENMKLFEREFRLLFTKEELLIEDSKFLLKFSISQENSNIIANVNKFSFKDYNISTNSSLLIKTDEDVYDMNGSISSDIVSFDYSFSVSDREIVFHITKLYSNDIKSLFSAISTYIKLDKELVEWVSKKAVAKEYYINDFKLVLSKKFISGYDIKNLSANAKVKNLDLVLNNGVESILIPNLDLNLSKEKLDFYFEQASFNAKDISRSKVFIYDITNPKKIGIYVRVLSDELKLDKALHKLLNSYGIMLPFSQLTGNVNSDFLIKVPFQANKKIEYSGQFILKSLQSDLANFFVKEGTVTLNNNKVNLKNFLVSNTFLDTYLNANIDTTKKQALFDSNIKRLYFDKILDMRDKNLSIDLNYNKGVFLDIKDFNLSLDLSNGIEFANSNMIKFKPYSQILQDLNVTKIEKFWLKSQDFNDFDISLNGVFFSNENILKNKKAYIEDDFYIKKIKDSIKINNKDKSIQANITSKDINLNVNNFGFVLKDIKGAYSKNILYNIKAQGQNLDFVFSEFNKSLSFDNANLSVLGDSIKFNAQRINSSFYLDKTSDRVYLSINGVNDKILNDFFAEQYVKNGTFSLLLEGKNFDDLNGTVSIKKTYITGLKFHNQLMSFIDTVPSLLLFKTPTFNNQGLDIQNGAIAFDKKDEKINVKTLALDGDTVDILGLGDVNLKDNSINIQLELKILKSASHIIANIPIINQVLLGKDRAISTAILVDGTIDDPKFHTQVIKEALKLPFDLINNIIQIPSTWFN